jgi:hypothetical protein
VRRLLGVSLIAATVVFALANPASATSIVVSHHTVAIGETIVVSGDTTVAGVHCLAGDSVTLISNAFKGHAEFAGVGAVNTPVDATGHFRVSVTITSAVTPGTYTISGRCGGGNLGVQTTLVVTGLPRTGASTTRDAGLGLGLLLGGVLLARVGRRRTRRVG